MLKMAALGCGRIGTLHAANINEHPRLHLEAVYDLNESAGREVVERLYPFPVNLDRDPPFEGMAPPSQQDLFRTAVSEGWETERFCRALGEHEARRASH